MKALTTTGMVVELNGCILKSPSHRIVSPTEKPFRELGE